MRLIRWLRESWADPLERYPIKGSLAIALGSIAIALLLSLSLIHI